MCAMVYHFSCLAWPLLSTISVIRLALVASPWFDIEYISRGRIPMSRLCRWLRECPSICFGLIHGCLLLAHDVEMSPTMVNLIFCGPQRNARLWNELSSAECRVASRNLLPVRMANLIRCPMHLLEGSLKPEARAEPSASTVTKIQSTRGWTVFSPCFKHRQ